MICPAPDAPPNARRFGLSCVERLRGTSVKRPIRPTVSSVGLGLALAVGVLLQTSPDAHAQAVPSPSPSPAASPAATAPAPRAGGFPMDLAWPMLAGGAATVGAGVVLLRRGRK
jgi:hypothetical protein